MTETLELVLKPKFIYFYLKRYGLILLILLIVLIGLSYLYIKKEVGLEIFLGGIGINLIFLAATTIYIRMYCHNTVLSLKNDILVYESGILSHNIITVPVKNVTDFTINRNLFERIFNVADIKINTAGGMGYEITGDGFDYPSLIKINNYLKGFKEQTKKIQ
jgi:uncharacterized membrane protein YdbT with pleckstrin-like domain